MSTLTIRKLDERTHARLRARAAKNSRSVEAEVRAILDDAVRPMSSSLVETLTAMAEYNEGPDLEIPPRSESVPRPVDLS